MESEIKRWYKKLWQTKGARFIAAKRYESHEKWATITISMVSIYIISLNLFVLLPDRLLILSNENITFSTICLSIFVIVISIIVSSRNYKILANKFHDCGREISEMYDMVCLWKSDPEKVTESDLKELIKDYNSLLKRYDINHSQLDLDMFKMKNISEFKEIEYPILFKIKILFLHYFDIFFWYWIFLLIPLFIYWFIIS